MELIDEMSYTNEYLTHKNCLNKVKQSFEDGKFLMEVKMASFPPSQYHLNGW